MSAKTSPPSPPSEPATSPPGTTGEPFTRWILGIGLTIIGLGIGVFGYILSSNQELAQRLARFQESIGTAQQLYCQQQLKGVTLEPKSPIDRALKLEPDVREELIALDYVTLASIGSYFLSYDTAHKLGLRALELAMADGDILAKYNAYLVLGHIQFLEYKKSPRASLLSEARSHFKEAEKSRLVETEPINITRN